MRTGLFQHHRNWLCPFALQVLPELLLSLTFVRWQFQELHDSSDCGLCDARSIYCVLVSDCLFGGRFHPGTALVAGETTLFNLIIAITFGLRRMRIEDLLSFAGDFE